MGCSSASGIDSSQLSRSSPSLGGLSIIVVFKQDPNPRILLFSQRNASKRLPFRCAHFEFEGVISHIDAVDLLAPRFDVSTLRHATAKKVAYHLPFALNPGIPPARLDREYELFLAICGDPTDLLRINALGNWRKQCRRAVCLIDELWIRQMKAYGNYLRMLDKFDCVFLYYRNSITPLSKEISSKCLYLPPGVDTLRLCPYPAAPKRVVDVYSMGRRSAVTHQALLELAAKKHLFYIYDSTTADQVIDPDEHRELFANIVKRSRYFIVNPGLIDRPDVRGDQIEIGNRYFEAAASGTLMIGERPRNDAFAELFDWPDSLIDLPYGSPTIGDIIERWDHQPERQERARRTSVAQSLLRHDWVHRWETILEAVDLSPLPLVAERKTQLADMADRVMMGPSAPARASQESTPSSGLSA
jgi:hypothetical protein